MTGFLQNKRLILGVILLATGFLGWRIFWIVNHYAPLLIVMDRWHTLNPLFYHFSGWEGFSFQHGPHRLGLIYYIFKINAYLSGWNSRWDMFTQAGIYVISALLALRLKITLLSRIEWSDLVIPLIFLTPHAGTTLTQNPYVHGLLPLFAIVLCNIYRVKNTGLRTLFLCAFSFIAAFTGFCLVLVPVVIFLELYSIIKKIKKPLWVPALVIAVGLGSLSYILITNKPNIPLAENSYHLWASIKYTIILMANLFLVEPNSRALLRGALLLLLIGAGLVFFFKTNNSKKGEPLWIAVVVLAGATVVFDALNLLGRSYMDIGNALASRYIPAGMCLALGVYFILLSWNRKALSYAARIVFILLLFRVQIKDQSTLNILKDRYETYTKWEDCLKASASYDHCEQVLKNKALHPKPQEDRLQDKLDFLKKNKLNIFKDEG